METTAQSKKKKILIAIILVVTIPIWLTLLNYVFTLMLNAGRITGTYIRLVESGAICPF